MTGGPIQWAKGETSLGSCARCEHGRSFHHQSSDQPDYRKCQGIGGLTGSCECTGFVEENA